MGAQEWQTIAVIASSFVGALCGVAGLSWWLAAQFQAIKDLVYLKFEAHERLDNERFDAHQYAIMRLELKAQNNGKALSQI